jgi:sec-independent protein translocase protein TatC
VENCITLQSYVDTLILMSLMMGVVFEIPIVCRLLAKLGWLTASFMRQYRRHAVVAILVVAAVITPTTDVFTLMMVAVPIYVLFEASIWIVQLSH